MRVALLTAVLLIAPPPARAEDAAAARAAACAQARYALPGSTWRTWDWTALPRSGPARRRSIPRPSTSPEYERSLTCRVRLLWAILRAFC